MTNEISNRVITLWAVPTANSQRVAILLEELGLPYRVRVLDRAHGEQHGAEFRAINPAGMAPAIVDPDGPGGSPLAVAQSGAILLYLAEQAGRLLPADGPRRALALQWLLHVLADVQATSSVLYFARQKVAEPHAPSIELFDQRLLTFLGDCDRAVEKANFLAGELSVADVALYPVVAPRRKLVVERGLNALDRWAERMLALPSVARGMAAIRPSPDSFKAMEMKP